MDIGDKAESAATFLKSIANMHRLQVLCCLVEGEKSVTELVKLTGISQTSMSQHLAKLRSEGIVDYRREHRILHYSIISEPVMEIIAVLYRLFCVDETCDRRSFR